MWFKQAEGFKVSLGQAATEWVNDAWTCSLERGKTSDSLTTEVIVGYTTTTKWGHRRTLRQGSDYLLLLSALLWPTFEHRCLPCLRLQVTQFHSLSCSGRPHYTNLLKEKNFCPFPKLQASSMVWQRGTPFVSGNQADNTPAMVRMTLRKRNGIQLPYLLWNKGRIDDINKCRYRAFIAVTPCAKWGLQYGGGKYFWRPINSLHICTALSMKRLSWQMSWGFHVWK